MKQKDADVDTVDENADEVIRMANSADVDTVDENTVDKNIEESNQDNADADSIIEETDKTQEEK